MTIEEIFNLSQGTGGLHNLLDVHIVRQDEQGRVTIDLDVSNKVLNPHGTAHGGTLFALCDIAVGTYIALQKKTAVTLDSAIHFYRPGQLGSVLTAVVNERKRGRTISVFLVEVYDDKENHIVDATFTMYYTMQP